MPAISAPREDRIKYTLHVEVEVLLEQMSVIARLFALEQGEADTAKRAEIAKVRKSSLAMRFQFDPYSNSEVLTMVERIDQYTSALQTGRSI